MTPAEIDNNINDLLARVAILEDAQVAAAAPVMAASSDTFMDNAAAADVHRHNRKDN